jgi:CMP-N-acetylneuraminic acid synthetase
MAYKGKTVLAVVPARGGSKGVPRKNMRIVAGKTLIAHVCDVIRDLHWIDRAVISTDDEEIAKEAEGHGLEAPFMRPAELAEDNSRSVDAWAHAWQAAETAYSTTFDISLLLEPTSPLRRAEDIERIIAELFRSGAQAVATVSHTSAHYTPEKTLTISETGEIGFYVADGSFYATRQRIPHYYHRNGICYAALRQHVVDSGLTIEQNTKAVVIDRPVVNIDDEFDMNLAEWLMHE